MSKLPSGWVETTLNQIAFPDRPRELPRENPDLPFIGMEHIESQSMRLLGTVPAEQLKSSSVHFQRGDVLYGRLRPYLNKVLVPPFEDLCSAEFIVFSHREEINSSWLAYLLNSSDFVNFASHLNSGDRPRVDFDQVGEYRLVLSPRQEQERIVAEIEKQFTRLDAATAAQKRVRANLKRYRASVLKAACEGKLVPTEAELARKDGRDYEPADKLLDRILRERRARWEADTLAKMIASGNAPKDDRWKQKYSEPSAPDTTGLPAVPAGWCWTSLNQLKTRSIYGPRFSSEDYSEDGIIVLRTTDISQTGRVDVSHAPRLKLSEEEFDKFQLRQGDLVFTRTGATVGKIAIFNDTIRAIPGAYLIHYRLALTEHVPWYVYRFFQSDAGQQALSRGTRGIGQPNLNAPTIEAIPIPLPPLDEQKRIEKRLDEILETVGRLGETIRAEFVRSRFLKKAVLHHAFSGRLVPQDHTDEAASVLLKRIRAERAASPTQKISRCRLPERGYV